MSELLPCPDPWCPTNKEGEPEFGDEPICVLQQYGGYAVQCAICELSGPRKRTKVDAEAAWNTRTESLTSRDRTIATDSVFAGHDRMDREGMDRWREIVGRGGHNMVGMNMTSAARIIASFDEAIRLLATLANETAGDVSAQPAIRGAVEAGALVDLLRRADEMCLHDNDSVSLKVGVLRKALAAIRSV